MEVENKLITNFGWLKELPEGECFRKPDSDEIFIKTNKSITKDTELVYDLQYCCVGLSKGTMENMPNIKVIPVSGKFVVNPDSHYTISVSDGGINTIPYISNIVAEDDNVANSVLTSASTDDSDEEPVKDANDYVINLPGGKSAKYDAEMGQFTKCEEKHTCEICRDQLEDLMFLRAKNAELEYKLEQCKEDNKVFPGYCMDCKNFEYITIYDNNTKKVRAVDCCKHWSEYSDGNKIFAETVADGYCYMFEPKEDDTDDTTGTWSHGICDNCGYDWGKDVVTASVPEYCPKCGEKKKISSI